jgi:hypothetical protein
LPTALTVFAATLTALEFFTLPKTSPVFLRLASIASGLIPVTLDTLLSILFCLASALLSTEPAVLPCLYAFSISKDTLVLLLKYLSEA